MRLNPLLLLCALTMLASCNRQNSAPESQITLTTPSSTIAVPDTVAALGNNIMTVYQDKKNNYWFGSWQDGLYHYDGKTILHYTTKNGLPHNRVEDIQEDKRGAIYINTSGGICKFDGQVFSLLQAKENGVWDLQPDDLWFKSLQFEGKVYRYDGKVLHELQIPESQLGRDWLLQHPGVSSPYGIYTIYKDSKKNIWFGTAALGACRYNGQSFDWISEEDVTELHNGPSNGVRSVIEDRDGYFWFNSAYRYNVYGNTNGQTFYNREKSIGSLDGRPDSDFWEYLSIARDNNNELWIATYRNGVWRYDGKSTTHYPVLAEGKEITLFSVYKDNNGGLWLGTHENGAYQFKGKTFERFQP